MPVPFGLFARLDAAARLDPARLRRLQRWLRLEHVAFILVLASGIALMLDRGLTVGAARWLDLKLGIVAFVFLPLEAMHAYVAHVWIRRGLRTREATDRPLIRGVGMQEMLATIAIPLVGLFLPLVIWLSVRRTL